MIFELQMFGFIPLEKGLFLALQGAACGLLSNQQWAQTNTDCYIQVSQNFVCILILLQFFFFLEKMI